MSDFEFMCESDYEVAKAAAVANVRKLMSIHQISSDEIRPTKKELMAALARTPVVIVPDDVYLKYYDISQDVGWNGIGAQPDWLRSALIQDGKSASALRQAAFDKMKSMLEERTLSGCRLWGSR